MPRTLTPAHRHKMAVARQRAAEARHTQEDRQLRVWSKWLKAEAQAYTDLRFARQAHGSRSPEAQQAYKAWRRVAKSEPQRPSDMAFKRARGEHDSETDSN